MNILLVYPEFLATFWSWKYLLKFVGKKAAFPPAGLLSIAPMLPLSWEKRLVDLNVRKLTPQDIEWADCVFISAMNTQKDSAKKIIAQCKKIGRPVILGGPILESGLEEFEGVDHFFVGEAEETMLEFLADLEDGKKELKRVYKGDGFPDISVSWPSMFSLIDHRDYASMLLQIGRGCPYGCTFCNVATINGRVPRFRDCAFFADLSELYMTGFRGAVLLADDNVMGNKPKAIAILTRLADWQQAHGYPFTFTGEFPITLADDPELMDLLVRAGFEKVFLGLETPNKATLREWDKFHNANHNMADCVKKMQEHGLEVMSGFIVGGDNDLLEDFDDLMIDFIQKTGIVIAMVGVLQAPPGSKLHATLAEQGRLLKDASGNNTDCYPNFVTAMPLERLVQGYKRIIRTIYSPKEYYKTICVLLDNINVSKWPQKKLSMSDFMAFMRSVVSIGILGGWKTSYYYWKTLFTAIRKNPKAFSVAVKKQIYGAHFQKIAEGIKKA